MFAALLYLAFGTSLVLSLRSFSIVTNPNVSLIWLTDIDWRPPSSVACAVTCVDLSTYCYSFLYDVDTQRCELGKGTTDNTTSPRNVSSQLLFVVSGCDGNRNYLLESNERGAICFWYSLVKLSYEMAVKSCKDKGLALISLRTPERMSVFLELTRRYQLNDSWVGLDDLRDEGVYLWVDNNSRMIPKDYGYLFPKYQPDDFNRSEDCVMLWRQTNLLNDAFCSTRNHFVCQVKMPHDVV